MRFALPAAAALAALAPAASADLISEFRPNPPGGDPGTQSFELSGMAGTSFDWWILSVESDDVSSLGAIDSAANVTGTFGANGLAVVDIDDLENPSFSVFLLDSFTGAAGDDIDTDNDGVADSTGSFGTVLDAIGIADDDGSGTFLYASQFGGTDFAFTGDEPGLVFRDGSTGDLFAVNDPADTDNDGTAEIFDADGNVFSPADFSGGDPTEPTFGTLNPVFAPAAIPEPGTFALLGLASLGGVAVRRRKQRAAA